jgi:hypothetical protein
VLFIDLTGLISYTVALCEFGEAKVSIRVALALMTTMIAWTGSGHAADFSRLVDASTVIPANFAKTAAFPLEGEIWANPDHPTDGQRYCVYQGKILCVSYTFAEAELRKHQSWYSLPGIKGLSPIDHVEFVSADGGSKLHSRYMLVIYFATELELSDVRPPPM